MDEKEFMFEKFKKEYPSWTPGTPEKDRLGYMRTWRSKNPNKVKAHRIVFSALRNGTLTQCPCSVCGKKKTEAHHTDYNKPLEVVWLCKQHHTEEHLARKK